MIGFRSGQSGGFWQFFLWFWQSENAIVRTRKGDKYVYPWRKFFERCRTAMETFTANSCQTRGSTIKGHSDECLSCQEDYSSNGRSKGISLNPRSAFCCIVQQRRSLCCIYRHLTKLISSICLWLACMFWRQVRARRSSWFLPRSRSCKIGFL